MAVILAVLGPTIAGAAQDMAIYECAERQTCDTAEVCVQANTRVVLAQINGSGQASPYLSIGPLTPQAGGGLFHQTDWRWVLGGVPAPSDDVGRAYMLSTADGVAISAHVFRPGREVRGLAADWVRADYDCSQVML